MDNQPIVKIKKRNHFISYIKGWAIVSIIMIHLIDWSNIVLSNNEKLLKELLYPGVLFFIATVGSVVYIAYGHYEDWKKPARRLVVRGLQLLGVYFLYNLIKLVVYNFDYQPFYWQFTEKHTFDSFNIIALQSFSVPIGILVTIAFLLIISPLFLWVAKKTEHPKMIIWGILLAVLTVNYIWVLPENLITNTLYSRNNVSFPFLLWLAPYLIGFLVALYGFEKHKLRFFILFGVLALAWGIHYWRLGQSWHNNDYMYPLRLYYVWFSFAFMYLLVWIFWLLEKVRGRALKYFLGAWRVLGDNTLFIYVAHWVVIDLTIWIWHPHYKAIWYTVPLFLVAFLIIKRKSISAE